jgi:hypothetical protein
MLASALMGLALYVFVHSSGAPAAAGARILQLAVALAVGGGVYLAVTALLRVPELSYVRQITRR